ncbi:GAP1-N1 domain-containing protein [Pseudomonas glycinis]
MRVEEAIYGEVNGGHALREASGDSHFAQSIASRLDLPDTAPTGVQWSPYISGFSHGDRYVIARTFIDDGASRSGMVICHALIAPLEELIQIRNLHSILERLAKSVGEIATAVGFDIKLDSGTPPRAGDFLAVVNAITTRGTGPVIRLGLQNFEELVASLWAALWVEARAGFGFRLSFGPTDVIENTPPTVVCTPQSLRARWTKFRVVNTDDKAPLSASAELLSGQTALVPILAFGRDVGADMQYLHLLPLLERAFTTSSNPSDVGDTLTAVRLIERISPDVTRGGGKKTMILADLVAGVKTATAEQISSMRNLALSGFPLHPQLWLEIEQWFENRQFSHSEDHSILEMLVCAATPSDAVDDWQSAVVRGISSVVRSDANRFSLAVWRWIQERPDLVTILFRLIPIDFSTERQLANSVPDELPSSLAEALLKILVERGWMTAHGAVLATFESPCVAVRRQIEVEGIITDRAGLEFALKKASPEQILKCATQFDDKRLINLAAEHVLDSPEIFAELELVAVAEQAIWEAALRRNPTLWQAPRTPFVCRDKILEKFVKDEEIYQPLLAALAATPLADLSDFASRDFVWAKMEVRVQRAYLCATADGWIKRAAQGGIPFVLSPLLMAEVKLSPELDSLLKNESLGVGIRIQIIEELDHFDEQRFLNWIQDLIAQPKLLLHQDAEKIGYLILRNKWDSGLREILSKYRAHRTDLKPALRICSSMLGWFDRWKLDISAVTAEEKWDAFVELAAQLYYSGPEHDQIWSRAGGENSDLPTRGSGKSMWSHALANVRNGRGPSSARLISEMLRDYSTNEQLQLLANDPEINGSRRY